MATDDREATADPSGFPAVWRRARSSLAPRTAGRLAGAIAAGVILVVFGSISSAQAQESLDTQSCLGCHDRPGVVVTLPSGEILDAAVDGAAYEDSVHGELSCVTCHPDIDAYPHRELTATSLREYTLGQYISCAACHEAENTETMDAVHARALQSGNVEAAVCTDCHGAHYISDAGVLPTDIALGCRGCHSEIYDLYEDSVHGAALIDGNPDVPTCTDCHGVHQTEGAPNSQFHLFSPQICATCHEDETLMAKYGISAAVFDTYVADFHGSTVALFQEIAPDQETNMPVCIDCHGVHHIVPADDPESTVFRENLLPTCQRCHPDATAGFSAAWLSHYQPSMEHSVAVYLVTLFYKIFIPMVIGVMLVFVILDTVNRFRLRRQERAI